jgi:hypothetical protein
LRGSDRTSRLPNRLEYNTLGGGQHVAVDTVTVEVPTPGATDASVAGVERTSQNEGWWNWMQNTMENWSMRL